LKMACWVSSIVFEKRMALGKGRGNCYATIS
jgi:hypothetical protein